ncbi:hypothetical protein CS062_11060 [Roseateles chitinivorans]|uniref:Uncharacterized protein n=1 Tax=Roseateles chitinivorans TaxID=2917965 RepID=A0A2G9C9K7_9BURK|nr:hypothetical protein [Roseateles chitinivorans]PIM53131.1 hypothetical protein CS062_11060 [Roseateles chitinivorans]
MTTVSHINGTGAAPVASRQLVSRPSGSFELNAREYGSVAAGAIGLAQAAWQGGENAVSTVVHWSEDGLQAIEDGAKAVGHAVSSGVSEVTELAGEVKDAVAHGASTVMKEAGELGSSVAGYLAAGAVAGKALIDEIL